MKTNPRPPTHVIRHSRDGIHWDSFTTFSATDAEERAAAWRAAHLYVDVQVIDHQPIPDGLRDPDTEEVAA